MRIFVVNWLDGRNPQAGGAEVHFHEIFGRLVRRGHEVTLLTSGFPGAEAHEEIDGVQVYRRGSRYTFGLHVPGFVRRRQGLAKYDVVVEDLNKVPLFMPFWTHRPVVLLVHHLFGTAAFQEASVPVAAATWLLEQPVPRVFRDIPVMTVSESTAADMRRRGMRDHQIVVVHNGVDLERLSPDPEGREFEEPTILYLGRIKRYKGIDLVLRAAARLKAMGVRFRVLIAGKGDEAPNLMHLKQELGLGDTVSFPGYVDEDEKVRLLRGSWVHTLTSPKEGWGISTLEAAACGTPTVASDSPGLRDSVVDGKTGILVPHGDVTALAQAFRLLLEDPQRRRSMGWAARAFAEQFTWDRAASETEAFLNERVAFAHPHG